MTTHHPNTKNYSRILIRSVNWLGDAIMSLPAIVRLKEAFPQSEISIFTPKKFADLWTNHPAIANIITFEKDHSLFATARLLRKHKFDLGIAFPNSHRSAIELFLGRIPKRLGYSAPLRSILLTITVKRRPGYVRMRKLTPRQVNDLISSPSPRKVDYPPQAHHIYHYLHLLSVLGINTEPVEPQVVVSEDEVMSVIHKFNLNELESPSNLIALVAGAEYGPAKRWLPDYFVQTAVELHKLKNCCFCITGSRAEFDLAEQIANSINSAFNNKKIAINLAGKTTLRELCGVLKACKATIANDTGAMHLSAAVGTRTVAIFGSTSPQLTAPGLPSSKKHIIIQSNAPCSPCFRKLCPIDHRCMKQIQPQMVINAISPYL